jgi:hypothetical protein
MALNASSTVSFQPLSLECFINGKFCALQNLKSSVARPAYELPVAGFKTTSVGVE